VCFRKSTRCSACRSPNAGIRKSTPAITRSARLG
jgi:hypothetical protein